MSRYVRLGFAFFLVDTSKISVNVFKNLPGHFRDRYLRFDEKYPSLVIKQKGNKIWLKDSVAHRTTGPAKVTNGRSYYFLEGKRYDFKEWLEITPGLTLEEKIELKLKQGI